MESSVSQSRQPREKQSQTLKRKNEGGEYKLVELLPSKEEQIEMTCSFYNKMPLFLSYAQTAQIKATPRGIFCLRAKNLSG